MTQRTFSMKTSLAHLPGNRRAWVESVANAIRDYAEVEIITLLYLVSTTFATAG